ncbi:unknown [Prevotella sp. CAG:617]|nr:unknown [Prevotella sp. CAG:617]
MDNYLQQGLELVDRYADEEVRRALRQYLKFVVKRDI